jgi:hypothetical protein
MGAAGVNAGAERLRVSSTRHHYYLFVTVEYTVDRGSYYYYFLLYSIASNVVSQGAGVDTKAKRFAAKYIYRYCNDVNRKVPNPEVLPKSCIQYCTLHCTVLSTLYAVAIILLYSMNKRRDLRTRYLFTSQYR